MVESLFCNMVLPEKSTIIKERGFSNFSHSLSASMQSPFKKTQLFGPSWLFSLLLILVTLLLLASFKNCSLGRQRKPWVIKLSLQRMPDCYVLHSYV